MVKTLVRLWLYFDLFVHTSSCETIFRAQFDSDEECSTGRVVIKMTGVKGADKGVFAFSQVILIPIYMTITPTFKVIARVAGRFFGVGVDNIHTNGLPYLFISVGNNNIKRVVTTCALLDA